MYASKTTLFALMAAFITATNGAIVQLYSDENCQTAAGSRNVYDNTCAPTGGFQSYKITTSGGGNQFIRAYSPNDCSSTQTMCGPAGASNTCYKAVNADGGSNAVGSSTVGC